MYIDLLGPQMVVRSPWHGSTSSSRLSADYHRERVQQPNYHACAGAAAAQILEPAPELMDMVDRERAAAALEEQLRPQRQAQKREAEAPRPGGNRNEGLEWSADGSARWKTRPERPEPGELARLAGLCWAQQAPGTVRKLTECWAEKLAGRAEFLSQCCCAGWAPVGAAAVVVCWLFGLLAGLRWEWQHGSAQEVLRRPLAAPG